MLKKTISYLTKSIKSGAHLEHLVKKTVYVNYFHNLAMNSSSIGISKKNHPVIISLTTYSKRIHSVYLTIETLLNQTYKPYKIILWLAENEFNDDTIPEILKKQTNRGLEIKYCKDIKSYKKLIPTLKLFPENIIITTDDDVLYPHDFVELLYKSYLQNKSQVHFIRGSKITLKNNKVIKYSKWIRDFEINDESLLNFPTGIGGILYPPGCFHKEINNEELFMKLAPKGDDIWFKTMTLLNGNASRKVSFAGDFDEKFITIDEVQDIGLINTNLIENDHQIKSVFSYFNITKLITP